MGATDPPEVTDDVFLAFARTRDPALRDKIVAANLGLAHQLARRFVNRGEPYDDLVQVASLALIKALDRFEPERGVKFSTFATRTLIGELKRHFRDRGWAVRAPRRVQEVYLELGHSVASLSQELGRSPTVAELAKDMGVTEDAVLEALEAGQGYRAASIDAPNDNEGTLADLMGANDPRFSGVEDRSVLGAAMAQLAPRGANDPPYALYPGADTIGDRHPDRGEPDARLEASVGEHRHIAGRACRRARGATRERLNRGSERG